MYRYILFYWLYLLSAVYYWLCVSVCLCVSVLSRERHHVQMLRASLSETNYYNITSRYVPVEGKSSERLICMKYNIIILIIIISLGQILYGIIANTSRMHTRTRTHGCIRAHKHARKHVHTHRRHRPPHRLSLFIGAQP